MPPKKKKVYEKPGIQELNSLHGTDLRKRNWCVTRDGMLHIEASPVPATGGPELHNEFTM